MIDDLAVRRLMTGKEAPADHVATRNSVRLFKATKLARDTNRRAFKLLAELTGGSRWKDELASCEPSELVDVIGLCDRALENLQCVRCALVAVHEKAGGGVAR